MDGMDVWEVQFEGVSDPREVGGYRLQIDLMTHNDHKE